MPSSNFMGKQEIQVRKVMQETMALMVQKVRRDRLVQLVQPEVVEQLVTKVKREK